MPNALPATDVKSPVSDLRDVLEVEVLIPVLVLTEGIRLVDADCGGNCNSGVTISTDQLAAAHSAAESSLYGRMQQAAWTSRTADARPEAKVRMEQETRWRRRTVVGQLPVRLQATRLVCHIPVATEVHSLIPDMLSSCRFASVHAKPQ